MKLKEVQALASDITRGVGSCVKRAEDVLQRDGYLSFPGTSLVDTAEVRGSVFVLGKINSTSISLGVDATHGELLWAMKKAVDGVFKTFAALDGKLRKLPGYIHLGVKIVKKIHNFFE
jgi:hypothetical protein